MGTRPRGADAGADGVGGNDERGRGEGTRGRENGPKQRERRGWFAMEGRRTGEHTVNIHGENPGRIRTCCD